MPHVVFESAINLKKLPDEFEDIFVKEPCIIKIENIFVDKYSRKALIPTVVVEEIAQNFFIEVSINQEKSTVRLYPGTDPEKTSGVMISIGLVAKLIQKIYGVKITKTNIHEYLE